MQEDARLTSDRLPRKLTPAAGVQTGCPREAAAAGATDFVIQIRLREREKGREAGKKSRSSRWHPVAVALLPGNENASTKSGSQRVFV